MGMDLPDPSTYGVSPTYGFLSSTAPLTHFREDYYSSWDKLTSTLPKLISSNKLQDAVEELPLLGTELLISELDYQRAYVVLAFVIHGFVWHQDPPNEHVPPQLAEPFLQVCNHIGMQPVISYAGLCTWNWRLTSGSEMDLHSMETLISFTGTRGEAAFYHVPVLIEYEGGHLMHLLLDAIKATLCEDVDVVINALDETRKSLLRMAEQLAKLYSALDADFFYHSLRPFMAGGKGVEDKGLPRGMVFRRSDGEEIEVKHVGGSAVQSALFPFLDCVLGVTHRDEVFLEMRQYMPGTQRSFLDAVSRAPSLRGFVESNMSHVRLQEAYESCLKELRLWRSKHIAVVSKYIVQPAREAARTVVVEKIETDGPEETDQEWELQGTGGSALIPFLRQARDETVGV